METKRREIKKTRQKIIRTILITKSSEAAVITIKTAIECRHYEFYQQTARITSNP